jgi:hypothetical protein
MAQHVPHIAKRADYVRSTHRVPEGFWPRDVCHCDYDDPPNCDCFWCDLVMATRNRERRHSRAHATVENTRTLDGSRIVRHFPRRRQ